MDRNLVIGFATETGGTALSTETYAGGRYLDLQLEPDGTVELDFNFAYNPLCAYNPEGFNCTLPPDENRLDFPVLAGEKIFTGGH